MIFEALQLLSGQLNDYLKIQFRLTEDIVFISPIKDSSKSFPNRVGITLAGVERETTVSGHRTFTPVSDSSFGSTNPTMFINLNVLISVIFQEKQYEESIHILSAVIAFIQKNQLVRSGNEGILFPMEIMNLSMHELSNLWSISGENYFPSVVCKIRMLEVKSEEIMDLSYIISKPEGNTQLK